MRGTCTIAGMSILALAWLLPLLGETSFAAHMITHMLVVAVAAPLLAFGLAGTRLDLSRHLTWVTPLTGSLIEMLAVWLWHLPQLRHAVENSAAAASLEQASFLAAGFLLWSTCLSASRLAGAGGLLFTSLHMTLLGVLLALAPRPLYRSGEVICFGVSVDAAFDQHVGGIVMLLVGAASYLIGGVALLHRLLTAPDGRERAS